MSVLCMIDSELILCYSLIISCVPCFPKYHWAFLGGSEFDCLLLWHHTWPTMLQSKGSCEKTWATLRPFYVLFAQKNSPMCHLIYTPSLCSILFYVALYKFRWECIGGRKSCTSQVTILHHGIYHGFYVSIYLFILVSQGLNTGTCSC